MESPPRTVYFADPKYKELYESIVNNTRAPSPPPHTPRAGDPDYIPPSGQPRSTPPPEKSQESTEPAGENPRKRKSIRFDEAYAKFIRALRSADEIIVPPELNIDALHCWITRGCVMQAQADLNFTRSPHKAIDNAFETADQIKMSMVSASAKVIL
jgi:hypothetical protein